MLADRTRRAQYLCLSLLALFPVKFSRAISVPPHGHEVVVPNAHTALTVTCQEKGSNPAQHYVFSFNVDKGVRAGNNVGGTRVGVAVEGTEFTQSQRPQTSDPKMIRMYPSTKLSPEETTLKVEKRGSLGDLFGISTHVYEGKIDAAYFSKENFSELRTKQALKDGAPVLLVGGIGISMGGRIHSFNWSFNYDQRKHQATNLTATLVEITAGQVRQSYVCKSSQENKSPEEKTEQIILDHAENLVSYLREVQRQQENKEKRTALQSKVLIDEHIDPERAKALYTIAQLLWVKCSTPVDVTEGKRFTELFDEYTNVLHDYPEHLLSAAEQQQVKSIVKDTRPESDLCKARKKVETALSFWTENATGFAKNAKDREHREMRDEWDHEKDYFQKLASDLIAKAASVKEHNDFLKEVYAFPPSTAKSLAHFLKEKLASTPPKDSTSERSWQVGLSQLTEALSSIMHYDGEELRNRGKIVVPREAPKAGDEDLWSLHKKLGYINNSLIKPENKDLRKIAFDLIDGDWLPRGYYEDKDKDRVITAYKSHDHDAFLQQHHESNLRELEKLGALRGFLKNSFRKEVPPFLSEQGWAKKVDAEITKLDRRMKGYGEPKVHVFSSWNYKQEVRNKKASVDSPSLKKLYGRDLRHEIMGRLRHLPEVTGDVFLRAERQFLEKLMNTALPFFTGHDPVQVREYTEAILKVVRHEPDVLNFIVPRMAGTQVASIRQYLDNLPEDFSDEEFMLWEALESLRPSESSVRQELASIRKQLQYSQDAKKLIQLQAKQWELEAMLYGSNGLKVYDQAHVMGWGDAFIRGPWSKKVFNSKKGKAVNVPYGWRDKFDDLRPEERVQLYMYRHGAPLDPVKDAVFLRAFDDRFPSSHVTIARLQEIDARIANQPEDSHLLSERAHYEAWLREVIGLEAVPGKMTPDDPTRDLPPPRLIPVRVKGMMMSQAFKLEDTLTPAEKAHHQSGLEHYKQEKERYQRIRDQIALDPKLKAEVEGKVTEEIEKLRAQFEKTYKGKRPESMAPWLYDHPGLYERKGKYFTTEVDFDDAGNLRVVFVPTDYLRALQTVQALHLGTTMHGIFDEARIYFRRHTPLNIPQSPEAAQLWWAAFSKTDPRRLQRDLTANDGLRADGDVGTISQFAVEWGVLKKFSLAKIAVGFGAVKAFEEGVTVISHKFGPEAGTAVALAPLLAIIGRPAIRGLQAATAPIFNLLSRRGAPPVPALRVERSLLKGGELKLDGKLNQAQKNLLLEAARQTDPKQRLELLKKEFDGRPVFSKDQVRAAEKALEPALHRAFSDLLKNQKIAKSIPAIGRANALRDAEERLALAERVLGRRLLDHEKDAILEAHFAPGLKTKTAILQDAGFVPNQIRDLFENYVCGHRPAVRIVVAGARGPTREVFEVISENGQTYMRHVDSGLSFRVGGPEELAIQQTIIQRRMVLQADWAKAEKRLLQIVEDLQRPGLSAGEQAALRRAVLAEDANLTLLKKALDKNLDKFWNTDGFIHPLRHLGRDRSRSKGHSWLATFVGETPTPMTVEQWLAFLPRVSARINEIGAIGPQLRVRRHPQSGNYNLYIDMGENIGVTTATKQVPASSTNWLMLGIQRRDGRAMTFQDAWQFIRDPRSRNRFNVVTMFPDNPTPAALRQPPARPVVQPVPPVNSALQNAANRLGVDLSAVRIENGVAECVVGYTHNLRPADIEALSVHFGAQGATSVKITTAVQNPQLLGILQSPNPRGRELLLGPGVYVQTLDQITLGNVTEAMLEITAPITRTP